VALYDLAVRGYDASVGMKRRALLCAAALVLALPGVASAAITLTPTFTATQGLPDLTWVDTVGSGPYNVIRDPAPCPSSTVVATTLAAEMAFTEPSPLADDVYCYQVQDTVTLDVSNFVTVAVDTTPPNVAFNSPPGNGTRVNVDRDLNATATDATSGVASVQLQRLVPGPAWVNVGPADTASPFTEVDFLTASLPDGSYPLRLLATDAAGNTDLSSTVTLVLDTVTSPPVITAPGNSSIHRGTFSVDFTNADGSTPVATVATASPAGAGTYAARTGLDENGWTTTSANDGVWDIRLTSQDFLGNPVSTDTVTSVTVDNTAPLVGPLAAPVTGTFRKGAITLQTPASDATAGLSLVVFRGSKNGGGFNVIGGSVTELAGSFSSTWTTTASDDGTWVIHAVATDLATNTTTSSTVTITVDNTLPTLPVFTGNPANNAIIGAGPMVIPYSGGADTHLVNVRVETQTQLQVAGDQWTPRTAASTTPVTWTPLAADDCTCNFRLVATDLAGNTRTSALRTNITIDNFAPIPPALFKIDRTITNGPPILTWTASPSGDIVGYKLLRDSVPLQGGGGLLGPLVLTYTDTDLPRDGSEDGAHGYALYANDGGNDSPVKVVNFLLDSMAPTPPTAATAKRRAGSRLVDLTWGDADDTQASSGATPTGVSRYVVRRAISPAVPSGPTSGSAACDVPANANSCVDTTAPEGHTYRYAVFAVDAASNGSAGAAPAAVTIPDMTPPGAPAAWSVKAKGLTIAMTWRLPTAADLLEIVIVRNATRSPKSMTDGKIVYRGKAAKAAVKQLGGTTAYYRAFAVDHAKNASATGGVRIKQPKFRLFPENGSELRGTVRLTWKKPKRATFFNVQLYLGSTRITQAWPKNASFKIPRSKLKKGKTYTWYVWPGVGKKSAGRYGTIIGKSTFTYLG
jgi:hypothetical protein